MATSSLLSDIASINLSFPSSPLVLAAVEYTKKHTAVETVNHTLRSAYFAVLLASKDPNFAGKPLNLEVVVLSLILHDMGWATTKALLSKDRRFEVDGAEIAKGFLTEHAPAGTWDKHDIQVVWDAIALHGMPSIALYKQPEVALTHLGVAADFFGPNLPGGYITVDEYKAIAALFPRTGFKDHFVNVMCGLCRDKTATTLDNFVGSFGLSFGLDGKGAGKEEYRKQWDEGQLSYQSMLGLTALEQLE